MVPAGGRGNPNTNAMGEYFRQTAGRRRYCSGSAETTNETVGRTITNEGRTLERMDNGGDQGGKLDTEHWDKLVSVTKLAFRDGHILDELAWTTMVLIPKSGGYYILKGLVEVMWKLCK